MKKILILLLPIIFITGCSSYTELNDLGLVSLLGIDYSNNNYKIYVTIMEGNQDDGTLEKSQTYFYSEASTLEEAFQNITLQSDKKIYLSHIDCLLVTDSLINNKCDISTCMLKECLNTNDYHEEKENKVLICNNELALEKLLYQRECSVSACCKLYKRACLHKKESMFK